MEHEPEDGERVEAEEAGALEPVLVTLEEEFQPEAHDDSDLEENANPIDLPIGDYQEIEPVGDPVEVEEHRDDDQTAR